MPAKSPPSSPFSRAHWVWPHQRERPCNVYAHFFRDFELKRVPRTAPLHITADQQYMLFINGSYVGRGPARGWQRSWPYDTHDVAAFLREGGNRIAVVAYNAGSHTFQYLHEGWAGLLCAAKWRGFEINSDGTWLCRIDPSHARHAARLSMQLNFQEHIDARLDDRRWLQPAPGKQARSLKGWSAPACRPFGVMPWHGVEPRGIPNLGSEVLPYHAAVAAAVGKCSDGWAGAENLLAPLLAERPNAVWGDPPVARRGEAGLRFTVPATGSHRYRAVILDLGRPGIGTWVLEAGNAAGGEVVDLFGCEWLDDDGGPHVPAPGGGSCWAAMLARVTLRKGKTRSETFQMIGHRYATLIVRDTRRPLQLALSLRHCVYPMDEQGRFDTSDAELNDIFAICRDTQRVCALDAYVDTPWREQAQWWGDARVQAWNTFHLSGDARLLARGIRQIAVQRAPNGLTYGHAPTMAHHCILPDFTLIWCLTLYDHYVQTGSAELFAELWPEVRRALAYFTDEATGPNGLLQHDPRYWLFLDWASLPKQGAPTLLNLWYIHTLDRLAELARAAGQHADAEPLAELRDTMIGRVMDKLFDRRRGLFCDGLDDRGKRIAACSIHNQTLAIIAGLAPEHHEHMRRALLLPYLRGEAIEGAMPSSYWVTYVYDVMRKAGYDREVIAHIRRHWSLMVPFGGCSEEFALDPDTGRPSPGYGNTFSHAWAAHPIYHLMGSVGGLTQAAPGWSEVDFRPLLAETDHCSITLPTPRGLLRSSWRRADGHADVELSLPPGVTANVTLPGVEPGAVTGRQRWRVSVGASGA